MEENNIKTTEIAKQDDNKKTKTTKVSDLKLGILDFKFFSTNFRIYFLFSLAN